MNIMQLLISFLFALPIFATAVYLLFIKNNQMIVVKLTQLIFSLLLLTLSVMIFFKHNNNIIIHVASWHAPFGISLVFDHLTTLMLVIFSLVIVCINIFSFQDPDLQIQSNTFYCGFWLLILGMIGALTTYDVFNLYVWSEVMLVSAFILLSNSQLHNTFKVYHYAMFNIVGTLLMLLAIAFIYGITGSLNYMKIAEFLRHHQSSLMTPALLLLLLGLGVKGGLFPFYFWLPNAYPNTSSSSAMLLASLITKVIMLVLLRLAWLWSPLHTSFIEYLFIFIASCTMFFGVMGAANHFRIRDILSFHIVSQLGYIVLAIFIPTSLAIIAAVYFLIHNVFVKTNLLMVAGIIEKQCDSTNLNKIGQLLKSSPLLASIFFIAAMSLAGLPPLSGFWGKLLILKAALTSHVYIGACIAIIVSLFTLYSMIKIWRFGFCQNQQTTKITTPKFTLTATQLIATLPLLIIPLALGLYPDIILPTLKSITVDLNRGLGS